MIGPDDKALGTFNEDKFTGNPKQFQIKINLKYESRKQIVKVVNVMKGSDKCRIEIH